MSVSTPTAPPALELPPVPVRRFTVEEYHHMIQAGVFGDDERFELLEGWIVPKMTRNPHHEVVIELIQAEILKLLPAGWRLRIQLAVTTADSEPEPDFSVVRGSPRDSLSHHPAPADIALVIEVADSSLAQDRGIKQQLYARAGIPRYWVVNLVDRRVEVYEGATGAGSLAGYSQRLEFSNDQQVPLILDDRVVGQVQVKAILP